MKQIKTKFYSSIFLRVPVILSLLMFGLGSAFAEEEGEDTRPIERLVEELQLEEPQIEPFTETLREHRDRRREIKERYKEELQSLREENYDKLAEILNEDQLDRYKEIGDDARERRERIRAHWKE